MRTLTAALLIGFLAVVSFAARQGPAGGPDQAPTSAGADDLLSRMMKFDKDKDGELTRAEVTDQRLLRLFDRADVDKDGVVTKAELTTLAASWQANEQRGARGFGPQGIGPRAARADS
jgi:hypothetical protein